MKLRRVKINNIRSYGEEEIFFPDGSTLLSGDIGSGKTSVLLSIEYALFGLQPGQRGSSLLANGEDIGKVELEVEIDGEVAIIERGLKRSSKSITQSFAALTINGERQELSVTELKTRILELLNYPYEFIKKTNLLYKYTIYTPQEEMKQIIQDDSSSRLDTLRHIFGIDKYKKIKANLEILTGKIREEARVLNAETLQLENYKNSVSEYGRLIDELEKKIKEEEAKLMKKVATRKKAEEGLKETMEKIKEKERFEAEIEKTKIMLNNKAEGLYRDEKEIGELEKKVVQLGELFKEDELVRVSREIIEVKKKIDELNQENIKVLGEIRSLKNKLSESLEKRNRVFKIEICPTCLQDVPEAHKHNIANDMENQLKTSEKAIAILENKMNEFSMMIESQENILSKLYDRKSELEIYRVKSHEAMLAREKLSSLMKSKESLEKDVEFLREHLVVLKNSVLEFTKFENIFNLKEKELRQYFADEKQVEINIAKLTKELDLTKQNLSEAEIKIYETSMKRERAIYLMELEKWLGDDFTKLVEFTEKNIMAKLRQEFSKLFNKWFSMLSSDAFHAYLDENFTPIIVQGEFEIDYAYLSGGERTAVALAYRLALNQIIDSILSKLKTKGLIILDEPTDGFSEQQLDRIRDILQELNFDQLILVSHEQKIEGFVDNIIRFTKEGGKSRAESAQELTVRKA